MPLYKGVVKNFPLARAQYLGKKAVFGQGELKSAKYDPIFTINHTLGHAR